MAQVSRPLLIALAAAVLFLALWMVALKPHGSSGSAPAAPKPAVVSQPAAPKPVAPKPVPHVVPAPRPSHHAPAAPRLAQSSAPARPTVAHPPGASTRLGSVQRALASRHVVALLFYNSAAADDQAVKQELAAVPGHGGRVFKLAIPLPEASTYAAVTNQVPVNISPTLVIIDRARHAEEIVGFADSFEIAQRLQDALIVPAVAR